LINRARGTSRERDPREREIRREGRKKIGKDTN